MNDGWQAFDSFDDGTTAEQFLEMVGALCAGTIGEADGRRLEALLAADPHARREYTNYMAMHACLLAEHGSLTAESAHESGAATLSDAGAALLNRGGFAERGDETGSSRRRKNRRPLATAAAIACVATFSSWATIRWSGSADSAGKTPGSRSSHVVARITGTRNCVWGNAETSASYGSSLVTGQRLQLEEGLAEITFEDGATVLLEGPATFDVRLADEVVLTSGRMAAVVPERARGFRVQTTTVDISDAGGEYAVATQETGATEVHVFNGLVKADVLDVDGRRLQTIDLSAAQAARVNPLSTTVLEFPADDAKFVRNIAPTNGPGDGLLAFEGFRYPEGPLEAQNGGFGWAGPWFNLSVDEVAGPDSNQVKPGSLSVEGLVPVGNRAVISAQYNRIRRALGTSVGGVFDAEGLVENLDEVRLVGRDGKTIYFSFLQRVSKTNDGFYGVELHRGDGNTNRVLCIGNGADESGYGATSNVNVYGAANLPSLGVENTDANFFVIKITFGVDNRDLCEVYRNPESLRDEQACMPDAVLRGNFAFDRISIADFDGAKNHEVDEIRVGTHFLAVTGRWGNNQGRMLRQVAAAELPLDQDSLFTSLFPTLGRREAALVPLAWAGLPKADWQ